MQAYAQARLAHAAIDTRTVEGANKEEIAQSIEEDGLDSDWVRVHVLGLFPRQSELQFIGLDVVDKARHYKAQGYESLPKILACDVACFGSCETVHGYRQGRKYVELERYRKMDTQFTGQRVIEHIKTIAGGIGGAVVDYCRALRYEIFAFDGSAAAHDSRKYGNQRAEVWAKGKFWLEAGAQIPDDDGLAEQITGPHFYYRQGQASHGALMIERKEDMSKRGLESPDRADTLMLTHAVDPAPKRTTFVEPPRHFPHGSAEWMG